MSLMQKGLVSGELESTRVILATKVWRVGLVTRGTEADAAVLIWPLGPDLWDLVFEPKISFDGVSGEDTFVIGSDEESAIDAIEALGVAWVAPGSESDKVVRKYFPDSRPAHGESPDIGP